MSKLYVAADHAGYELKSALLTKLKAVALIEAEDLGTHTAESCDYPEFAQKVASSVLKNSGALGFLICGTGIGMSIAANKIKGIRSAVVSEPVSARMSREHNNAQILCVGARVINEEQAWECLWAFLTAKFDTSNPRHQRRIDAIAELERNFS